MLLDSRVLELNSDCCEFCPVEGSQDLLAAGTYQLDEATQTRKGKLFLFSDEGGDGQVGLVDVASVDVSGIFDMKWIPVQTGEGRLSLGVASADGNVRIFVYQKSGGLEGSLTEDHICENLVDSGMLLALDWSKDGPVTSMPETACVSSSSGELAIAKVGPGGMDAVEKWQGHDLEAWSVAFDHWKAGVLYSGADDCKFKGWDLRSGTGTSLFCNSKAHGAGICCIVSSPHLEHELITGSYDEKIRFWDTRNTSKPVSHSEVGCGGGVWTLKYHPHDGNLLLAACMYNGFAIVRRDRSEQEVEVVERYTKHESLAYGADWRWGCEDGQCRVATCSFYDNLLHLWETETKYTWGASLGSTSNQAQNS
ncbi:hypothetical protein BSKO_04276 [Bryopsis sp. KO-2023]|nr:hypothetical protein BSKO_04276 [Bryopsis sp. KO-2023]